MSKPKPRWKCTQCGTETGAVLKVCPPCLEAGIDPPTGGRWVNENGVQHWRKWTDEECAERTRRALRVLPEYVADPARHRMRLALENTYRRPESEVA